MKKRIPTIYIAISAFVFGMLLTFLTGCSQPAEQNLGGGVVMKEFELAGEKVIVGGSNLLGGELSELADFKPEVKLEKWGDETYIRVWSDDVGDKTATQVDDKVVWQTEDKEYNFYTTTFEGNEAFEYEIILKEKPKSNVITLNIETKDLEFYYQPALTQEEIDKGFFRPENVIGSYAVYHITKKGHVKGQTNYMTGKAFHIYRPQTQDAKGNKVWGELSVNKSEGTLSVTIPQKFLDKAVYPISHATGLTFGYDTESHGASTLQSTTDQAQGTYYVATAGDIESLSFYLVNGSYDDGPQKLGIYTGTTFLKGTDEISSQPSDQYNTISLTSDQAVSAATYSLVHFGEETSIAYDNVASSGWYYNSTYPGSWPTGQNSYFYTLSIYATYAIPPSPTAITDIATSSSQTSVNFKGYVDVDAFDGDDASFEYGTTEAFGATTTPQTLTASSTFYFNQTGLTTLTPYYYRAVYDSTPLTYGDTGIVTAADVATSTWKGGQWDAGTLDTMESSSDSLIITLSGSVSDVDASQYCSAGEDNDYFWIDRVVFEDIDNTTGEDGVSGYVDHTDVMTVVVPDESSTITVYSGDDTVGNFINCVLVWIDWDQDEDLTDETPVDLGCYDEPSSSHTGTITIPSDFTGSTLMRVFLNFNADPDSPCGTVSYGEIEDYSIGYTAVATTGTWTSLSTDLSDITSADGSKIECATTTPANTELSLYTGINTSASVAPTSWDLTYCGVTIPNATGDLSSNYLWSKIIATSTDGIANVAVDWLTYGINIGAAAEGTNTQINIGDAWKAIEGMQINIGDVWKDVEGAQINIGDTWETIY